MTLDDVLRSLIPGWQPTSLQRPATPKARARADRQLRSYPELRGLAPDTRWAAWADAWPKIASHREVQWCRLALFAGLAMGAWLGGIVAQQAVLEGIGPTGLMSIVFVVALVPLGVLVLGVPLALVNRVVVRRRARPYLRAAVAELAGRTG